MPSHCESVHECLEDYKSGEKISYLSKKYKITIILQSIQVLETTGEQGSPVLIETDENDEAMKSGEAMQ